MVHLSVTLEPVRNEHWYLQSTEAVLTAEISVTAGMTYTGENNLGRASQEKKVALGKEGHGHWWILVTLSQFKPLLWKFDLDCNVF